jgi:hypothetical protein
MDRSRGQSLDWWVVQTAALGFMLSGLLIMGYALGWFIPLAVLLVLWGNNLELRNRAKRQDGD